MRQALWLGLILTTVACTEDPVTADLSTECSGDFEVYEPGMTFRSDQGNFDLTVLSATPDPPDEGDNDWVVRLDTVSGTPVSGGVLVLTPYMPAHDHGISPPDYTGQQTTGDAGEYTIPTFDLIMPGVWEFRVLATEGMQNDTLAFSFCVEG